MSFSTWMRGTLHSFTALFSSCAESEDKRAFVSRQHCFLEIWHAYVEFNALEEPNIFCIRCQATNSSRDDRYPVLCFLLHFGPSWLLKKNNFLLALVIVELLIDPHCNASMYIADMLFCMFSSCCYSSGGLEVSIDRAVQAARSMVFLCSGTQGSWCMPFLGQMWHWCPNLYRVTIKWHGIAPEGRSLRGFAPVGCTWSSAIHCIMH